MGLQRIIFNIFQLTSTDAMSSYKDRCVKIGVVFHALYFKKEVGDPQFFCICEIGSSLPDCSQTMKKICVVEVFRANVLKVVLYSKKVMIGCKSHYFLNSKIVNFKHLGMLS